MSEVMESRTPKTVRPQKGKRGTLVLSRKKNESIIIAGDIEVFIVEIRGDKVRLGIRADESVSVHRREVHEAIERNNLEMKLKAQKQPAVVPDAPASQDTPMM